MTILKRLLIAAVVLVPVLAVGKPASDRGQSILAGMREKMNEVIKTGMVTTEQAEKMLKMTPDGSGIIMNRSQWNIPRLMTGPFMAVGDAQNAGKPMEVLQGFLSKWTGLWNLKTLPEYRILDQDVDQKGNSFVRVIQEHNGIRIDFSDQVWHFDAQGRLTYFAGLLFPEIEDPSVPGLDAGSAMESVIKAGIKGKVLGTDLVYIDQSLLDKDKQPYVVLAWKLFMSTDKGSQAVYVDAQTGDVLGSRPIGAHAFSSNVTDASYDFNGTLVDAKRISGRTPDFWDGFFAQVMAQNVYNHWYQYCTDPNDPSTCWHSYDNQDSPMDIVLNYGFCEDDVPISQCGIGSLHYATCQYAANYHKLVSYMPNISDPGWTICGYDSYYNYVKMNSEEPYHLTGFWNGPPDLYSQEYYFSQRPAMVFPSKQVLLHRGNMSQDFVAHEFDHAFNDYTSGLGYWYRSGAVAETLADALAVSIDTNNWTFGENTFSQQHYGCVRNIADPTQGCGGSGYCHFPPGQPDTFNNYYYDSKMQDFGRVHRNSGIGNKAFFLLADQAGNQHTFGGVTVTAVGRAAASEVWFYLQREYLFSMSTYSDFRVAAWYAGWYYDYIHGNTNYPTMTQAYNAMDAVGIWWNAQNFGSWNQAPAVTNYRVAPVANADSNGNSWLYVWYNDDYTNELKARVLEPGVGYQDIDSSMAIDFAPVTVANSSTYAQVFAVQEYTNKIVHYSIYDHGVYGPWIYSATTTKSPAAIPDGTDLTYLFTVDSSYNVHICHAYYDDCYNDHIISTSQGNIQSPNGGPSAVIANNRVWLAIQADGRSGPAVYSMPVSRLSDANAVWDGPAQWPVTWSCGSLNQDFTTEPTIGVFTPASATEPRLYLSLGVYKFTGPFASDERPRVLSFVGNSDGTISDVSRITFVPTEQEDGLIYPRGVGGFIQFNGFLYMFVPQPYTDSNAYAHNGVYAVSKKGY